jgi:EAL domain-containing protein (putative c-di-GMP-specific phosphodiesterase class I)
MLDFRKGFKNIRDSIWVRRRLNSLLEASRRGELVLFYQPKVDMAAGLIIGVEALLRWEHPQLGLLPPDMFGRALKTGFNGVIDISHWTIQAAIRQISEWGKDGLSVTIGVNVLASELTSGDFCTWLRGAFARYPDVNPSMLELEIVESSNLGDIKCVIPVIAACRSMGVKFALDDFGTAYSSLAYVRHLPADFVKIDQSFVKGIILNQQDQGIVRIVVSLAETFDCKVIAEGVESIDHGLVLLKLGCKYAQGYAISRPMPASELPRWIAQYKGQPEWMEYHSAVDLDWVAIKMDRDRGIAMHAEVLNREILDCATRKDGCYDCA